MNTDRHLQKHLTPLGAWAFGVGTAIGWGALVVMANTYLAQAGPLGSVLGLAVATLAMLIIGRCYAYLMCSYPEAGGAYTYAREAFGYDHGFLAAWFLAMTYLAILWANATSLPMFARMIPGSPFSFGRLYTVFGYDVYIGEVLLSVAALTGVGWLCIRFKKLMNKAMTALALVFAAGIVICFVGAIFSRGRSMAPAFVPDAAALSQVVRIAVISPWI